MRNNARAHVGLSRENDDISFGFGPFLYCSFGLNNSVENSMWYASYRYLNAAYVPTGTRRTFTKAILFGKRNIETENVFNDDRKIVFNEYYPVTSGFGADHAKSEGRVAGELVYPCKSKSLIAVKVRS